MPGYPPGPHVDREAGDRPPVFGVRGAPLRADTRRAPSQCHDRHARRRIVVHHARDHVRDRLRPPAEGRAGAGARSGACRRARAGRTAVSACESARAAHDEGATGLCARGPVAGVAGSAAAARPQAAEQMVAGGSATNLAPRIRLPAAVEIVSIASPRRCEERHPRWRRRERARTGGRHVRSPCGQSCAHHQEYEARQCSRLGVRARGRVGFRRLGIGDGQQRAIVLTWVSQIFGECGETRRAARREVVRLEQRSDGLGRAELFIVEGAAAAGDPGDDDYGLTPPLPPRFDGQHISEGEPPAQQVALRRGPG